MCLFLRLPTYDDDWVLPFEERSKTLLNFTFPLMKQKVLAGQYFHHTSLTHTHSYFSFGILFACSATNKVAF